MKLKAIGYKLAATAVIGSTILAPTAAHSQDWFTRHVTPRRHHNSNEWRDIAAGAGALGVLGLLTGDNTLFFAGGAGALYSGYRYDQDRHSRDRSDRLRAEYFGRPYFYRDGVRYSRHTDWRDGQKYYYFERDD